MKYFVVLVVLAALGWLGFQRYLSGRESRAEAVASAAIAAPAPASAAPAVQAAPLTAVVAPKATSQLVSAAPAKTEDSKAPIKIDLAQALGPNNQYSDSLVGLSVTLPEGWTIRDAIRWGDGHRQNTVFLKTAVPSTASPSMYYKPYTPEESSSIASMGAQALLREQAQKKEASRSSGGSDYKNVPDSFHFFDVNGSPAMTYFATFTRGDQVMTEHFIRVLGPNGYTMFFTSGRFEDVKAIMPQLKQTASTVKGP